MGFLIPPHPLINFEIQNYYKNEPRFNGVFSRNNLAKKIKDGVYVKNLDEYPDVYSLQKLLVAKSHSLLVAKFARYSLQRLLVNRGNKSLVTQCKKSFIPR